MKKILIILIMVSATILPAQDKIDKLSDKVDKLAEQMAAQQAETNKQIAIIATKVDGFEKSMDKRLETQSTFIVGLMGLIGILIAAMLGFISYIFWDRQTALKPIETTSVEMQREINLLKEKELKHTEKELKLELLLKKLLEKFPDLANLA